MGPLPKWPLNLGLVYMPGDPNLLKWGPHPPRRGFRNDVIKDPIFRDPTYGKILMALPDQCHPCKVYFRVQAAPTGGSFGVGQPLWAPENTCLKIHGFHWG